ncbi:pyrroline-5-carboxylate reductase [Flavobacterium humi]|uniref:Pyrroline-5-carboxylate reductase n=1 Tax=Flavobacterium humi TaxID=2562683 RepID=A0A4Z0L6C8_9FLAO|nr:pyrroline-5-carboxylate reductase [Flavobacterium humi]TGD57547.1 pyrroline-5-carboxylate reductase [Flavobacterium humi]
MNIHIIGGGNLGVAIALGISKYTIGNQVVLTRRNAAAIAYLEEEGIKVSSDNTQDIEQADIIILTVKPYQVESVLQEIAPKIQQKTIASAVSGVSVETLSAAVGISHAIVRIMPNIAIQFGESATCIAFEGKDKEAAQKVISIFQQLGTAPVIEEKLMDAATVLGACGTAYALRYIRASMQAGIEIGFDSQTALAIAAQTAKGAARMLLEEKIHPEQLIDRVTTPQGCTIVGLNEMEHQGFSSSLIKGIKTSLQKIKE